MELIRDIFNSHKVFIFGSFNCSDYKLDEFYDDITTAEHKIFGDAICTPYIAQKGKSGKMQISEERLNHKATLYPSWLIQDDLFEVLQFNFAVGHWINELRTEDIRKRLNVFCCVIPEKVVSLYDHSVIYEHSIGDIKEYLDSKAFDLIQCFTLKKGHHEVIDIFKADSLSEIDSKNYSKSGTIDIGHLDMKVFGNNENGNKFEPNSRLR